MGYPFDTERDPMPWEREDSWDHERYRQDALSGHEPMACETIPDYDNGVRNGNI